MRIVIAGAGSVGTYMAEELGRQGHEVTLIDNDQAAARRAETIRGITAVFGDACDVEVLARAEVARADVVAAVTGDDEDNLVVALLSKQEFAVSRVVARVNNPKNEWMFDDMWGVDLSVSTPHLLTALVEEAVTVGSLVRLLNLEHGEVALYEVTLADDSPATDTSLADLGLPREASVVAVVRSGHVVQPHPELVVRAGDEVVVLARHEAEQDVRDRLAGR